MIKKLRYKFVIIIMIISLIMLTIIFGLIYFFTSSELREENIMMMSSAAAMVISPTDEKADISKPIEQSPKGFKDGLRVIPCFILKKEPDGSITSYGSEFFDLSDAEITEKLYETAEKSDSDLGTINEYKLRFFKNIRPDGMHIVFSDISNEISTLSSLLEGCIFIGIAALGLLFLIAMFLSKRAVKPVATAWEQQRQFVADASHELKTPLTVIITNSELLSQPEFDEESKSKFGENILIAAKHMRVLVEQLLELARADNGQLKMSFADFNLSELLESSVMTFEPVFYEKGLTCSSSIKSGITMKGSEQHISQAVNVLLDNAQKYCSANGSIKITAEALGKAHIRICVANTGEKLPEAELKNIFKRFYRADKARSRDGSFGLGLSIAEAIVLKHGGKIYAVSDGGINSFYIELPIKA